MSFNERIKKLAEEDPNKPAFIFVDKNFQRNVLTRHDLYTLGQKCAKFLEGYGVQRGDVVCNTLRNSPLRLVTQIGAHMAGAVDMNGQICLADGEDFIHSLRQGKSKVVIVDPNDLNGARKMLELLLPQGADLFSTENPLAISSLPALKAVIPTVFENGATLWEKIQQETEQLFVDTLPSDECTYMCTSGSTGLFKIVAFTNKTLLGVGNVFGTALGLTDQSIFLNDRPLGWIGGYPIFYAAFGSTRVLLDCSSDQRPENPIGFTWRLMDREKCTVSYAVPLQLEKLIEEARSRPHTSGHILDVIGTGSGPVLKRHMKAIGVVAKTVRLVYGSTESGISASLRVTEPDAFEDFVSGAPTQGTEIKVVDPDGDLETALPTGQQGEILQRTNHSCCRYVGDEKATKETFLPNGWIRLGDNGFFNDKGQLSVLGRNKFAILRGPFVVYPEQLEIRIAQCPGVENVVVTGVPDAHLYEEICVLIMRKSDGYPVTEKEVRHFCETTIFAHDNRELNALPKYFLFVESFPVLENGKLNRREVKRMAESILRLCR